MLLQRGADDPDGQGHARRQRVQRLGDMAEQVSRQIQIGQGRRGQQQNCRDSGKNYQRQLESVEYVFYLLHGIV